MEQPLVVDQIIDVDVLDRWAAGVILNSKMISCSVLNGIGEKRNRLVNCWEKFISVICRSLEDRVHAKTLRWILWGVHNRAP